MCVLYGILVNLIITIITITDNRIIVVKIKNILHICKFKVHNHVCVHDSFCSVVRN